MRRPGRVGAPEAPGLPNAPPAVKICGLTRREDAETAVRAGADYLGVVLVPDTPRAQSPREALELTEGLESQVVVVTADLPLGQLTEWATAAGAAIIQLHGKETPEVAGALRESGLWRVWKALRVREVRDVLQGFEVFGGVVDGILLDGWHPHRRGGTGTPFSWVEVERVRGQIPGRPTLIAAGGLNPENVGEAVARLRPHVVDVSSGVETRPGIKSPEKIRAFIRNAGKGVW